MSDTYRTDKKGKKYRDGNHKYKCKCDWCLCLKKKELEKPSIEEELKIGVWPSGKAPL